MEYKEFIQAVDSLTNDALVANREEIPWKVNVKDEVIEVVNQNTELPLLIISKRLYGSMRVYPLNSPTAVAIFDKAVMLNRTPLDERDEVVTYNPLHNSIKKSNISFSCASVIPLIDLRASPIQSAIRSVSF